MDDSLKEYSNIFEQIKNCKYPDITIEIDDYPRYNTSNVHLIIRAKGNPWYSKYVTSSQYPYYEALCEEELQRYIKNARQFFKTTKNVFKNRGESDYFVDDVIILDKNFSKIEDIVKGTNKTAPHDILYIKIVK